MRYMLLIYSQESRMATMTPADLEAEMGAYFAFNQETQEAGVLNIGEALHPTANATTVRVRSSQTTTTDGPFAETKEQLGGFYIIDVENLDDAIAWAAKIPSAQDGCIEIRPIVEFE